MTRRAEAWRKAMLLSGVLATGIALGSPSQARVPAPAGEGNFTPATQEQPPATARLVLPREMANAIGEIYKGDPDTALAIAEAFEKQHPEDPLGFLVEGEARYWKLYCGQNELRYGMVDVWELPKKPANPPYLAAAQQSVRLAVAELQQGESAQAELWAGMGYALEARIRGLRGERRATAHAGVSAREHLLKAIQLDPTLADADTALGLYNYYVDTLSPVVKLMRFFMGIPGGSKGQGVRQLRQAMEHGELTNVEARFYLAKNLRTYDQKYSEALAVAEPLVARYPGNPIFLLLVANLKIELGRKGEAAADLEKLSRLEISDGACAGQANRLAKELLGPTQ